MIKKSKLIVFAVFGILVVFLVGACASTSEEAKEPAYISPYNWENLKYEDGRFFYYKDDQCVSKTGIDVSDHQGEIDWALVADDNIDFAFIRVGNRGYTEGGVFLDTQFKANLENAQAVGIEVGVYFFSQAISVGEACEEAEFVLEQLSGVSLDYPVVYDFEPIADAEGRANSLTRAQLTEHAEAFCEVIEEAGYKTMIYGNKRDIGKYDPRLLSEYDIWFAEYGSDTPSGQFDFTIWQYANSGEVAGIDTQVDMNIHFLKP